MNRLLTWLMISLLTMAAGLADERPRLVVSTDIGGTDPDDFQSMVHLLVYADALDIEGLISSAYGPGRKEHILEVINAYERDYPNLRAHSPSYPSPDELRAITRQGETETAPYAGFREPTEGSEWLVKCARRNDTRPLHVLVWGGMEDLAQALHDAPDILPKLRVYFIGGPNKKWSVNAYQYIVDNHPQLWIIEANSTYRGWFHGGDQAGDWGNTTFVARHVAGHGALGELFVKKMPTMKMGDSPSVAWLLSGEPENPAEGGWGGRFVRARERPYQLFGRLTDASDEIEVFSVLELALPISDQAELDVRASLSIENQELVGHVLGDGTIRFRFSPKAAKRYEYSLNSNQPQLDQQRGSITVVAPSAHTKQPARSMLTQWWVDDTAPAVVEGEHFGAATVSQWRKAFLQEFADRMDRCMTQGD